MTAPHGVSAQDFAAALKQFEEAVGKEWVFTSDEDVALYRDAYSPFWGEPDELVASAAVAPDNVEEVQKVVRIATTSAFLPHTGNDLSFFFLAFPSPMTSRRIRRTANVSSAWYRSRPSMAGESTARLRHTRTRS
jgi:hypothetical protein